MLATLDEFGRAAPPAGVWAAAGPVVPPMPVQRRSGKWPALLNRILKASPRCLGCGRKAETGHHVVPVGVDPALELVAANVVPVCVPCHFVLCHAGDWHTYLPDAREELLRHAVAMTAVRRIAAAGPSEV